MNKLRFKNYISLLVCWVIGTVALVVGGVLFSRSIDSDWRETVGGILITLGIFDCIISTNTWVLHYKL